MKWCWIAIPILFFIYSPLHGGDRYLRYQEILKFKETYRQGKAFFSSGEYREALTFFLELLEQEDKLPPKARKFVHFYAGESYFQLELYDQALKHFKWLVDHPPEPHRVKTWKRLMEIYYLLGMDNEFLKFYPRARKILGKYADELDYMRGRIFLARKSYGEAVTSFSEVPRNSNWYVKARYFMGYALLGSGKITDAVDIWKEVLKTGYKRDSLLLGLGILEKKLGHLKQAESYFSGVTEGSPLREDALYDLAWVQIDQNKLTEALDTLKKFALSYPTSKKLGEVGIIIGYIYLSLKKFKDAYLYFTENQKIFKSLEKQMELFRETHGLPEEFYVALEHPSPETVTLPTVIRNWVLKAPIISAASDYIDEAKNIKLQIEEIKYTIHDLALRALSPENEKKSPAYMDLLTLDNIRNNLVQLLDTLLKLKAGPIENYMYNEEKLILNRIVLLRENLLDLQNSPEKLLEVINEKRKEIEALRNYLLTINPDILEGKTTIVKTGNLKVEIPNAREVMEKFYLEINALTQISLDLFSLRFWIKNAIDYTFLLQNKMLDIILYRLGIYSDKRYDFFVEASDIFENGWGILHTISGVEEAIARIERKNFMKFYANAVTQERELNYLLASLDVIHSNLKRVRGGLAMEEFAKIRDQIHNTVVKLKLGNINVVWKAKEEDEKLSKKLLDEKEEIKNKIVQHYKWVVEPTHQPPPKDLVQKDLKDYLRMLKMAEASRGNRIYVEQLKKLGDMVAQLIGQYYRVQEVITRMEKAPLQ